MLVGDAVNHYHVGEIELDYKTREKVIEHVPEVAELAEMSDFDSAFLCGVLKRFKPNKVVEVGISNGGTTAIVIQCLHDMGLPFDMWSVDISEHCYRGRTDEKSGFLGEAIKGELKDDVHHQRILGNILPECLDRIGEGIDFLLLDTVHALPGEVLDFLAAFPYLAEGAVVCLHDISNNFLDQRRKDSLATNALFNAVVAEKYVNPDSGKTAGYPNIGAFVVNADTSRHIANAFGMLLHNWQYIPDRSHLELYSEVIDAHYDSRLQWIYYSALELNLTPLPPAADWTVKDSLRELKERASRYITSAVSGVIGNK